MELTDKPVPIIHDITVQCFKLKDNTHLERWSKKNRGKIAQQSTKTPLKGYRIHPSIIDTRKKMANWIFHTYGCGHFRVMIRSKKNNLFHSSPVSRAKLWVRPVIIRKTYFNGIEIVEKEEESQDECEFDWEIYEKPTKNNPQGRADKMYHCRTWWRGDVQNDN